MISERIDKKLLTKQGLVARNLARTLVGRRVGAQVTGIAELAVEYGVGYGTVHDAMRLLEEAGAVRFRSRGAQGTIVEEIHDEILWFVANAGRFVGSMPLPYSRRYEGLATGLHRLLDEAGIPTSMSYMRGGIRRLEALGNGGANFAITSLFTAESFLAENPGAIEMIMDLGPRSYVVEHHLIFADPAKRRIEPGMRVGIDRDSADQTGITEMEIEDLRGEVTLLPMTYTQVIRELENGNLDVVVWNAEDVNGGRFNVVPLESPKARELGGTNTVAAVSVASGDEFSARVLRSKLDRERLLQLQRDVLAGEELPRY